jgi:hypothetical protein
MSLRPRYSLAALLIAFAAICVGLAAYRDLSSRPVYPLSLLYGNGTAEENTYAFRSQYSTKVPPDAIARAPSWDRRNPNPPLPAVDAMVRAEQVRKRFIKERKLAPEGNDDPGEWSLISAQLIPYDANESTWVWRVLYEYLMDQTGPPNEFAVVVLMDGTVIEPEVREQPHWQGQVRK